MAPHGQFETAAHAHSANGGDDRLGAVFDLADQSTQIRVGARLGRTEFTDIRAAGEARSRAHQHDGLDAGIRIGASNRRHQRLAQFEPETVDRRIVELEDGDAVLDLETQFVHATLSSSIL
jgi:hypothetical protein